MPYSFLQFDYPVVDAKQRIKVVEMLKKMQGFC